MLYIIYTVKGTNNAKIAVEFDDQQKREKGAVNRVVSTFKKLSRHPSPSGRGGVRQFCVIFQSV